jgi:hypothetical protein
MGLGTVSYKQKTLLLFAIGIAMVFLALKLAVSETVRVARDLREINHKLGQVDTAPERIRKAKEEINALNQRIGQGEIDAVEFQRKLFEEVSQLCEKYQVVLRDFPGVSVANQDHYQYITGKAVITGDYFALLGLLHEMEVSPFGGKVSNAGFSAIKNRSTGLSSLYLSLHVQSIKTVKNEEVR